MWAAGRLAQGGAGGEVLKAVPVGSPPAEDEGVARECPICLNEVRRQCTSVFGTLT